MESRAVDVFVVRSGNYTDRTEHFGAGKDPVRVVGVQPITARSRPRSTSAQVRVGSSVRLPFPRHAPSRHADSGPHLLLAGKSHVAMTPLTIRQLPVSELVPPRLGRNEEHWTDAGPAGTGEGMVPCDEHGEM